MSTLTDAERKKLDNFQRNLDRIRTKQDADAKRLGSRLAETHDHTVQVGLRVDAHDSAITDAFNRIGEIRETAHAASQGVARNERAIAGLADEVVHTTHDANNAHGRLERTGITGTVTGTQVTRYVLALAVFAVVFVITWALPLDYSGYESWHVLVFSLIAFFVTLGLTQQWLFKLEAALTVPGRTEYQPPSDELDDPDDTVEDAADATRQLEPTSVDPVDGSDQQDARSVLDRTRDRVAAAIGTGGDN